MAEVYINTVESVLLFLNLQIEHISKATLRQSKPKVDVTMDTSSSAAAGPQTTCRLRACGLGAYFLKSDVFIRHLCLFCPGLINLLQNPLPSTDLSNYGPFVEVLARKTGDPGHITRCTLEGLDLESGQAVPIIRKSVIPRPSDLHPASLLVNMRFDPRESAKVIGVIMSRQLHLLHLINPEISLSLNVKESSDPLSTVLQTSFSETATYKSLYKTPYKLVTSVTQYIQSKALSSKVPKLQLFKGDTQTLQRDGTGLKVHSMVGVVPQIFVYGPCSLPLVQSGSHPGFPLSLLADWDQYGLSVRSTTIRANQRVQSVAVPSYTCEISNIHLPLSPHLTRPLTPKHTLCVFLFIEDPTVNQMHGVADNIRWRHNMKVVHTLRRDFQELIVAQSKKFHQAIHSALNKIVCNYGSYSKTKVIMRTALPLLADAVASIIKQSKHDDFKDSCMQTLQVDSLEEVCENVEHRLWRIAKDKLRIQHPTDDSLRNPDEPSTPELSIATGSHNDSQSTQPMESNTHSQSTQPMESNTHSQFTQPMESNTHSQSTQPTDVTMQTRPDRATVQFVSPGHFLHDKESSHDIVTEGNTQSLFAARVTVGIRHSDSKLENSDSDDSCFESLGNVDEHINLPCPSLLHNNPHPLIGYRVNDSTHTAESTVDRNCLELDDEMTDFDDLENSFNDVMDEDTWYTSDDTQDNVGAESSKEKCDSQTGFDELEFYEDVTSTDIKLQADLTTNDPMETRQFTPDEPVALGNVDTPPRVPTSEERAASLLMSEERAESQLVGHSHCIEGQTLLVDESCSSDDEWDYALIHQTELVSQNFPSSISPSMYNDFDWEV